MNQQTRREFLAAGLALGVGSIVTTPLAQAPPNPAGRSVDDFFRDFTADWVRHDPSLATATRYFTGEEQDRLERQLTPRTLEWRRERIRRARQGLAELRRFDRSRMTDLQRVSVDVMNWQLDTLASEEPYLDYTFPLQQMNGANVQLVETMTVRRPLLTERDAENYVVALGQVRTRMEEAVQDARRLETRKIILPRFILAATSTQMRAFVDIAPAQSPFVTVLGDRMSGIKTLSDARREQLREIGRAHV